MEKQVELLVVLQSYSVAVVHEGTKTIIADDELTTGKRIQEHITDTTGQHLNQVMSIMKRL